MLVSLLRRALGVRRNGDGFAARLHEGYARLQLGDAPGAKRMAMGILSEDPAFVGAHLLHAQAAADGGEWGIALAAIERLLAMNPKHPDAHFIRGMVREQLGEAER
ncbi:MAG: tetratricopeptide repeat protein, partial [Burkholderiales bacterium]